MNKNVTIAHISDLHLAGKDDRRQIALLDRLLDELCGRAYDHVVITGDLIDTANPDHWLVVMAVLERHGLFSWQKTTLIPGNHDLINLEEEMRFYNALNPNARERQTRLRNKLSRFCDIFQPLITGEGKTSGCFPFIKVFHYGSFCLALVAVNSVFPWSGADNPLGARGYVPREELRLLTEQQVADALEGCFVIGLCHHAYRVYGSDALIDQAFDWTMELKNRNEWLHFMKILHARMVLHGHFHRFQSYLADGMTFINGGSFRFSPNRYSEILIGPDGRWSQRFVLFRS
jgi:3',5'-cyclic AMP phosphodiesterase CpdA